MQRFTFFLYIHAMLFVAIAHGVYCLLHSPTPPIPTLVSLILWLLVFIYSYQNECTPHVPVTPSVVKSKGLFTPAANWNSCRIAAHVHQCVCSIRDIFYFTDERGDGVRTSVGRSSLLALWVTQPQPQRQLDHKNGQRSVVLVCKMKQLSISIGTCWPQRDF